MALDFMAIPAVAAVIAAWNTLKEIFAKILGVVFITIRLDDTDLYMAFWYYARVVEWQTLRT